MLTTDEWSRRNIHPEARPGFNLSAPVGWVTCYPPMVLTSDDGPVRNELRTLRSHVIHQPCFYQKPSPFVYALSRGCYVQDTGSRSKWDSSGCS